MQLREISRFIYGSPTLRTYDETKSPQHHDLISIYRLSKQGVLEKAAPLYENGASLRAIAREMGVPKTTIRQTLIDAGVALRAHSKRQLRSVALPVQLSVRNAHYGYCLVAGQLVEDPKEMFVVQLIMQWWREGMSHGAIARRLNDQRIKPRKAAKWSQPTVGFVIKRHESVHNSKEKRKWESKN